MARSEEPSVPTGVRIDQAKVLQWHNDLVRFTDNFALEKLERIYTAMAKVNFYKIEIFKDINVLRRLFGDSELCLTGQTCQQSFKLS